MGEFLNELNKKKNTPAAIYHRFRTQNLKDEVLYVFLEGYDDLEFYPIIFKSLNIPAHGVVCFGKKNMDEVIQEYKRSPIRRARVIFIRDRDFDLHLGVAPEGENLFLTCGYSVENYVCQVDAIERYIKERMGVDPHEHNISEELQRFEEAALCLNTWLTPIYGRVFDALEAGKSPDLDAIDISKYIKRILRDEPLPEPQHIEELNNMGLDKDQVTKKISTARKAIRMRGRFWRSEGNTLCRLP